MSQSKFADLRILRNYSLCVWEIRYRLPDAPSILAPEFVLQREDLPPQFPELKRYLDWWTRNIEGKLHSVRVASQALIQPTEFRLVNGELRLH